MDKRTLLEVASRLKAAADQVGHPDYSLAEFRQHVYHAEIQLRTLAAAQSRLAAAKEAIDFLHWMESAAPKTLETLESWREQFEYATNSKLSADKRGDSGS